MRRRRVVAATTTSLAFLLVWAALTAPNRLADLTAGAAVRLPLEGLIVLAAVLVLPAAAHRPVAVVAGLALGLVAVLKILDVACFQAFYRPFDPVLDWRYAGAMVGLLQDSVGRTAGTALVVGAGVVVVAVLVLMPLALVRLTRLATGHRRASLRLGAGFAALWVLLAVVGVHAGDSAVASAGASTYAYGEVSRIPGLLGDEQRFAASAGQDPLQTVPPERLLTGLRGKDVVVAFIESYGRVALQDPAVSPGVEGVLRSGTKRLGAAGYGLRSAFLTSPTFGGISWLAHSTFASGLWVDNEGRYDQLLASRRMTLSAAFRRAGWRTVADVPANTEDWPQGAFYHYDHVYDSRNVGYAGPRFGYPTMPDQYTLDAFGRSELGPGHRAPVMAEIDLVSSHTPWSPIPRMVPQNQVGDGSVFAGMPEQGPSKSEVWSSTAGIRAAYGQSIQYSLDALVTFVETYGSDRTVLVLLGDHQPASIVAGDHADHDVPITVIARDPAVLQRISGWGWQPGMLPSQDAPVWRMDAFRDRFLAAFGPG